MTDYSHVLCSFSIPVKIDTCKSCHGFPLCTNKFATFLFADMSGNGDPYYNEKQGGNDYSVILYLT